MIETDHSNSFSCLMLSPLSTLTLNHIRKSQRNCYPVLNYFDIVRFFTFLILLYLKAKFLSVALAVLNVGVQSSQASKLEVNLTMAPEVWE